MKYDEAVEKTLLTKKYGIEFSVPIGMLVENVAILLRLLNEQSFSKYVKLNQYVQKALLIVFDKVMLEQTKIKFSKKENADNIQLISALSSIALLLDINAETANLVSEYIQGDILVRVKENITDREFGLKLRAALRQDAPHLAREQYSQCSHVNALVYHHASKENIAPIIHVTAPESSLKGTNK
jgi:hypothetical protein